MEQIIKKLEQLKKQIGGDISDEIWNAIEELIPLINNKDNIIGNLEKIQRETGYAMDDFIRMVRDILDSAESAYRRLERVYEEVRRI